jgi:GTPase Era involved in 16S rRNA processing
VDDLRKYLFDQAKTASWLFHPKIKSDLSPPDLVLNVIKSKCLEVFEGSIGYTISPKIGEWKVENEVLRLNIQFIVAPSVEKILLADHAAGLRAIAKLSECDLQNFFQTPVFVGISVHTRN